MPIHNFIYRKLMVYSFYRCQRERGERYIETHTQTVRENRCYYLAGASTDTVRINCTVCKYSDGIEMRPYSAILIHLLH